ncbi:MULTISPECIES: hypothetical protein [unclassified Rhizobium]|uniref:hypothetical protein n=1 Tax=unclassified Rhizobium TaxID=2613769 RepID=UPI00161183C9|nr:MULTISPECIES: hypothetical protein [unclassified Rhizobium]MBB3383543.1 hypothetical protein [Rhizobium sp. BK098]MBB3615152.1 hypothetical protein [Rhizobium sp. BK609]MBB3680812.1 hypothetical protein [Rhizobium sp. BK612]
MSATNIWGIQRERHKLSSWLGVNLTLASSWLSEIRERTRFGTFFHEPERTACWGYVAFIKARAVTASQPLQGAVARLSWAKSLASCSATSKRSQWRERIVLI